mmetsp:Transcript_27002/g.83611  ORF Transcript_27002/g.83611 Transcript_27002/m.83611 type:complete len:219 (-) Transcript_27002:4-660(-)
MAHRARRHSVGFGRGLRLCRLRLRLRLRFRGGCRVAGRTVQVLRLIGERFTHDFVPSSAFVNHYKGGAAQHLGIEGRTRDEERRRLLRGLPSQGLCRFDRRPRGCRRNRAALALLGFHHVDTCLRLVSRDGFSRSRDWLHFSLLGLGVTCRCGCVRNRSGVVDGDVGCRPGNWDLGCSFVAIRRQGQGGTARERRLHCPKDASGRKRDARRRRWDRCR